VKRRFLLLFIFLLLSLPTYGIGQPSPSIQIYVFYADDCPSCGGILQGHIPALKKTYPFLEIETFDIGNPSYYEALVKLEKQFGRKGDELPILFIGDQMLSGQQEVTERLDPLILEYQMKEDLIPSLPPIEIFPLAHPSEKTFSVDVVYFYQKGCPKCDRANYLLKYLIKKYSNLRVKERLVQKYEESGVGPSLGLSPEEIKKAEQSIVERFKSLGILAILTAGLIEGLNPCAFATLIFFISYLTMVGRKRKEIFWVGMGFTGTGFVTHLLLGLGILNFIQHLSFLPLFSRIIYLITFLFALLLGILSLYDYIQLKRGLPSKMKLQVPNFLKKRIHQTIRIRSGNLEVDTEGQSIRLFIAAIVIGFVVTLLQFTCTSQVYLPTILFVTNIPSLRGSAVFYLIFYNLLYIAPLVIIFGIVYWGVTSEQLSFFLQRRTSTIKLLTSIFFFALAGILIFAFL